MISRQDVQYLRSFLFFYHSSAIIIISFLPLYFEEIGLSGTKIGLLLAMGPFVALIFQPLWGYFSDKYKTIKKSLMILLVGVAATAPLLFQTTNIYLLLAFMAIFYSFFSPIGALGDSLTQRTSMQYGNTFGSIRSFGSIGFAVTGIIAGYVLSAIGIKNILFPYLFYTLISLIIVTKVSDVKDEGRSISFSDTKKILKNREFVFFIFFMLFIAITHRANDTYLGIFISSIGGNESLVGWAWFVGVSSEAIIFATSHYWLRYFKEITLISIAALLYSVRWFLFSIIDFPMGVIILQLFHGVTFGVFYLTGFQLITNLLPRELYTTGHSIYTSFFFGLAGIAGSLMGGAIIEYSGAAQLYLYLGITALIGSIMLIVYRYIFFSNST